MVLTNTTVVGSGDGSTVQIHTALRSRLSTQDHTGNDHNSRAYTRVADSGNEGSVNLTHRRSHANEPKSASVEKKAEMQLLLRKVILEIQNDKTMSETEKAKKMQDLLSIPWKKYVNQKKKKLAIANALQNKYLKRTPGEITAEDLELSYHDREKKILGCKHYQRAVKLQCSRCNVWAVCRFCHDEFSEHCAISNDTSRMMCMYCKTTQPIGQVCTNKDCGKDVSRYFCKTCLLWDSDPKKNIYHCDKCGICRIGKGLGIDYFHCDKCGVCLAICLSGKHRCIERNIDCDCPICGEYMFTSTSAIMFMRCCHCIHVGCYKEYIKRYYQCPTCFKSLADMTEFYNRIDSMLALEKMPKEYNNWYSQVYCNDCESKCPAKYHFMYHKCLKCEGYNTKVIDILKSQDLVNREDLIKIETLRNKIQSKVFGQHKECKDVS